MSSLPPRVSAAPPGAPTGPPAGADAGWATAGSGLAAAARDLATRIGRDIEGFKAGRVPWRSMQTLQRQADALATRGVDDPAVERMLREQSQRIAQQGRSLGDDGGWDAVELVKSSIRDAQAGQIGRAHV